MSNPLYATDSCFHHSLGFYPLTVRCEMLRELGYDATTLTLRDEQAWNDAAELAHIYKQHRISVAHVHAALDVAGDDNHPPNTRILHLLANLEGSATLELSVYSSDRSLKPSDARADEAMAPWLGKLLRIASARGITISLHPQQNNWLQRIEDAVRLCKHIEHPHLGVTFSAWHWYAADGRDLPGRVALASPYLHRVSLCGVGFNPQSPDQPCSTHPLDRGELDNFALLGLLREHNYAGPIGIDAQVGGDVYANLRQSLNACRDMLARLDAHPHWAQLHWK